LAASRLNRGPKAEGLTRIAKVVMLAGPIIVAILSILPLVSATGLGVSPTEIIIRSSLRGGEYQRAIRVFNAMDEDLGFVFNVTGYSADWISLYADDNFTKPINNMTVPVKTSVIVFVVVRVPLDASNGNHSSNVYVQTVPVEVKETGAKVVVSAPVKITVEVVGTQVLAGEVNGISTLDTEVNYPLRIDIDFQNTGNVVANPEIDVEITKEEDSIENFTFSKASVKPGMREVISVEWDTTGKDEGEYWANVTVSLGGEVLREKSLSFKLLPIGTVTRKGELVSLSFIGGNPVVGLVIKIQAAFRNTGLIDTTAEFVGEVYRGGELVDVIEGYETLVKVGKEEVLSAYLKLTEEGEYLIKGWAVYDGKKTDPKELSIVARVPEPPKTEEIVEEEQQINPPTNTTTLGLAVILVVSIMVITLGVRYAKKG